VGNGGDNRTCTAAQRPPIKDWPRISRRWKGDGVLLGTEAGPDVLLYWNGKRWWVAQGTEAP